MIEGDREIVKCMVPFRGQEYAAWLYSGMSAVV